MLVRHAMREWPPMRACRRRFASTTSPAHHELDVKVLAPRALDVFLAQQGLTLRQTICMRPEEFLGQALRPTIAGFYVYPSSAPLHAAHRLAGSRSQSRAEIPPGGCLLRGPASRRAWTLAIPPLLSPATDRERMREFAVLTDLWSATLDQEGESFQLEVHRPRAPSED